MYKTSGYILRYIGIAKYIYPQTVIGYLYVMFDTYTYTYTYTNTYTYTYLYVYGTVQYEFCVIYLYYVVMYSCIDCNEYVN